MNSFVAYVVILGELDSIRDIAGTAIRLAIQKVLKVLAHAVMAQEQ